MHYSTRHRQSKITPVPQATPTPALQQALEHQRPSSGRPTSQGKPRRDEQQRLPMYCLVGGGHDLLQHRGSSVRSIVRRLNKLLTFLTFFAQYA